MKEFKDLKFRDHYNFDGIAAKEHFKNGYGVSVIKAEGSYGYEDGLYEITVLKGDRITYETPITQDVIGHLSESCVTDIMAQVQGL